jgi:hypothetical protein
LSSIFDVNDIWRSNDMFDLAGAGESGLKINLLGLGAEGCAIAQYIDSRGVEGLDIYLNP